MNKDVIPLTVCSLNSFEPCDHGGKKPFFIRWINQKIPHFSLACFNAYHIQIHLHNFSDKREKNSHSNCRHRMVIMITLNVNMPMLTFSEKNLHGMHQTRRRVKMRKSICWQKKCEIWTNKNVEQYFINFYLNSLTNWLASIFNICYHWNLFCSSIDFYFAFNFSFVFSII